MTSEYDDDQTRHQPAKKSWDRDTYIKLIPYILVVATSVYAFIFAPMQATWVALGFIFAIGLHFGIKIQLEDNRYAVSRQALLNTPTPVKRSRTAIPYPEDMVGAYMREGRGYWVRHYQHEGMGGSQDDIEFAEESRRLHLRGQCEQKTCYFCHFHQSHAPYV